MNTLKLILPAVRLLLPKLIRQGLTALGGLLAAEGFAVADAHSVPMIITGLLLWGFTSLHSAWVKTGPDAETMAVAKKIVEALLSQGMSFLSGWLASAGYAGNPADAEAVSLFLANLGLSAMTRPGKK